MTIPIGIRGLIHIWGQNNMTTSQKMGIRWVAKNPSGVVAEDYEDDAGTIGAGATHEFIGGRFDLNIPGTWTIVVGLFMGPGLTTQVASYSGTLCIVEQLKGTIIKKELEYDSARGAIPVQ